MEVQDGLRLSLQFYSNHCRLKQVEDKTGVPAKRIENFLENDILSEDDRLLLSKPFQGKD